VSIYRLIINCAYYPTHAALNSPPVLEAFVTSLRNAGIQPVENGMDCDAAVIWSVLWNGRMAPNKAIYEHYRSQGKPVFVIDVGALKRNITWKIAVNNINGLGHYGHTENLDPDRPGKLGLQLHKCKPNDKILLCGQHQKSLQWQGQPSMSNWILHMIGELRRYTDRHIRIRPHPRSRIAGIEHEYKNCSLETPQKMPGTYDQFDIHYEYHLVVNYCSGPGIKAGIDGANVLVDRSSLAYPISTQLQYVENPPTVDRELWFQQICHTEYTLEEIAEGLWLKRLSDYLEQIKL